MQTTEKTALELIHRLLFQALIEIRSEGQQQKNKVVFHLADMFHNAVLDMQAAAEGSITYEETLRGLQEKAQQLGCERWLQSQIEASGTTGIERKPITH